MDKISREKETVTWMIGYYCRQHHSKGSLCSQCADLLSYALMRLDNCPHGNAKPSCRSCPVHCYKPTARAQIKDVMRYCGPRMIVANPLAVLRHMNLFGR